MQVVGDPRRQPRRVRRNRRRIGQVVADVRSQYHFGDLAIPLCELVHQEKQLGRGPARRSRAGVAADELEEINMVGSVLHKRPELAVLALAVAIRLQQILIEVFADQGRRVAAMRVVADEQRAHLLESLPPIAARPRLVDDLLEQDRIHIERLGGQRRIEGIAQPRRRGSDVAGHALDERQVGSEKREQRGASGIDLGEVER
jgi:hypothetical protein